MYKYWICITYIFFILIFDFIDRNENMQVREECLFYYEKYLALSNLKNLALRKFCICIN